MSDKLTISGSSYEFDFAAGDYKKTSINDSIKILGSATTISGGSIALKNFTETNFHINNDIYKINGSKLNKQ